MTVITIFAYLFATLFFITLFRAVRQVTPEYWNLIKGWWLRKIKGYSYFPFEKGNIQILAGNKEQAYDKFKAYKKTAAYKTRKIRKL